jgi:hypothetical protein
MKGVCEQSMSTTILQTKGFRRNLAETMDISPEIENMILEARTT